MKDLVSKSLALMTETSTSLALMVVKHSPLMTSKKIMHGFDHVAAVISPKDIMVDISQVARETSSRLVHKVKLPVGTYTCFWLVDVIRGSEKNKVHELYGKPEFSDKDKALALLPFCSVAGGCKAEWVNHASRWSIVHKGKSDILSSGAMQTFRTEEDRVIHVELHVEGRLRNNDGLVIVKHASKPSIVPVDYDARVYNQSVFSALATSVQPNRGVEVASKVHPGSEWESVLPVERLEREETKQGKLVGKSLWDAYARRIQRETLQRHVELFTDGSTIVGPKK